MTGTSHDGWCHFYGRVITERLRIRCDLVEELPDKVILKPRHLTDPDRSLIVVPKNQLHSVLADKLKRQALLQILTDYSLIEWDGTNISMHPLLREIIASEMSLIEKQKWYSTITTERLLAYIFQHCDDQVLFYNYNYAMCRKLLEDSEWQLKSKYNISVGQIYKSANNKYDLPNSYSHDWEIKDDMESLINIMLHVVKFGNLDLISYAIQIRRPIMQRVFQLGYSSEWYSYTRAYEQECFQLLADLIGCHLVYQTFCTKDEYRGYGLYSKIEGAVAHGPTTVEDIAPIREAIDLWADDMETFVVRYATMQANDPYWQIVAIPYGMDVAEMTRALNALPEAPSRGDKQ